MAILLVVLFLFRLLPASGMAADLSFRDVQSSAFYYNAVQWAVNEGITNGTAANTFSPDAVCTRSQVVTFLYRAMQGKVAGSYNPFRDIAPSDFFYSPVLWAVSEGITNGTSASSFSPEMVCTRAQAVTFLWRAAGCPQPKNAANPFADVPANQYYSKAVLWAVEKGITNGTSANKFSPDMICSRSQIVTFLYRCCSPLISDAAIYLFNADTERQIRKVGQSADLMKRNDNEYHSFAMILKNNTDSTIYAEDACVVVDQGQAWYWQDFSLAPGASTLLHIYAVNMRKCAAVGSHTATWYINGKPVCTANFVFTDSGMDQPSTYWENVFPLPTQSQINAYTNPDWLRSPYIAGWLDIGKTDRFTEYSIDFKADHAPVGTYCCLANWVMDMSELKKTHTNVHTEYSGVSAYAGFQNTATEKGKATIMSFWDIYATDPNGKEITIRPTLVYPEYDHDDEFSGEGTGAHRIVPYDWKENHWYRMLLQSYPSPETGNTLVDQWVCDLETGKWTRMCCYDTGLKNSHFVGSVAFFLENYLPQYAGEIRSMEVANVRVRDLSTGQWRDIEGAYLTSQGGKPKYEGSYAFGSREDRFWMITSGVGGDWYNNGKGQMAGNYTIQNTASGNPY